MTARVCLAISTFRSDDSARALVAASQPLVPALFERILVVDSMGNGALKDSLGPDVEYFNSPINLGSAGNLARRLTMAADAGFDFVFALNHDGHVVADVVQKLVSFALSHRDRLGAVYPIRRYTQRNNSFDLAGLSPHPLPFRKSGPIDDVPYMEASWSSSNGALYDLNAVRAGMLPYADFWMGWEDLVYGWALKHAGYLQYIVTDAVLDDDYEYMRVGVGRAQVAVSDKPAWYAYYTVRNLLLATEKLNLPAAVKASIAARIALEFGMATAVRPQKLKRLQLLTRGLIDGLRGTSGKGEVP